jgi:multiple sugar transport system permease protein
MNMKLDRADKRLRAVSYIITTIFIIAMLFPLFYMVSISLQPENAIYKFPPQIIPSSPESISVELDYSEYADLPEEELIDMWKQDVTMAMYSSSYELGVEDYNVGEVKVYGTMNGKTILYSRAHNLTLRMEMQYGSYFKCRIAGNILLTQDRYKNTMDVIGYEYNPEGLNASGMTGLADDEISTKVAGYLNGDYKSKGVVKATSTRHNNWLFFENYKYYFSLPQLVYKDYPSVAQFGFFAFVGNTLITVGFVMFCQTMIPAITAYPLSKLLKKRAANNVLLFFLATMMIPYVVVMIPQQLLIKDMGLFNTLLGMMLPSLVPAPFAIYLYKGFFDKIPGSYFEAARIDGANEFFTFFRICMPMSGPIFFLQLLQSFIWGWGDFMWYYLVGNRPNLWTINVAIYTFSNMAEMKQNFLMGVAMVTVLPVVILAAIFSKQIKQSVMGAGLKE